MVKITVEGTVGNRQPFTVEYTLPDKMLESTTASQLLSWLEKQNRNVIAFLSDTEKLHVDDDAITVSRYF